MVYIEARDGEPAAAHRDDEGEHGGQLVPRYPNDDQEEGLAPEASAVEDLPHIGCAEDLVPAQVVGQLAAERHDQGHDEVGKRRQGWALRHVHPVDLLEVLGLGDEEEVEGPGPCEVGDDDRPHWHARKHLDIRKV